MMTGPTPPVRHSRAMIALHWVIAVTVLFNYVASGGMGQALRQVGRGEAVTGLVPVLHVWAGIAVLVLVAVRLVLRWRQGAPALPADTPPLLRRAGTAGHFLLYGLLLLVPGLGLAAWYGGIRAAGEPHQIAANILMVLAGLHAAVALFHHYVLKDGLLRRMGVPL